MMQPLSNFVANLYSNDYLHIYRVFLCWKWAFNWKTNKLVQCCNWNKNNASNFSLTLQNGDTLQHTCLIQSLIIWCCNCILSWQGEDSSLTMLQSLDFFRFPKECNKWAWCRVCEASICVEHKIKNEFYTINCLHQLWSSPHWRERV